jgi:signal transduction histidine kinase
MVMGRGSLGARLLLGAAVWVTLALLTATVVLTGLFREHAEAELAQRMAQQLDELVAALDIAPDGALGVARDLSEPLFQRPLSGFYWQVTVRNGRPLRSRSLWDQVLPPLAIDGADGEISRRAFNGPDGKPLVAWERAIRLPDRDAPVLVTVAIETARLEAATASFTRALVSCLGVLAVGMIGAAVAQVRLGLRPLRRLGLALRDLRAGKASQVTGDFPNEVRPLVDDLNTLLRENAKVVERARAQAGDLAHALKNPLTVITNEVMALGDPEMAERIASEAARMRRHVDLHLARARAAATAQVPGSRTLALPAIEGVARAVRRLHAEQGIAVTVRGDPAAFRGAAQDLQEMAGNLLDNAAVWARGQVEVTAIADGGQLVVTVDDDGPGIPEPARALALARGGRLDESVPGTGLGLAIVADLADLYGGTLALDKGPLGGLRAVLTLPLAAPDGATARPAGNLVPIPPRH